MQNNTAIKGPAFAREAIRTIAIGTRSQNARVSMAKAALRIGNYTDEAKALWAEYLAAGCPREGA